MWNDFLAWAQKISLYRRYWRWLILEYILIFIASADGVSVDLYPVDSDNPREKAGLRHRWVGQKAVIMIRFISCIGLFLFTFNLSNAQFNIRIDDYAGFLRDQNLRQTVYSSREQSNVAGSPYLRDTFQKGEVLMRSNVKYTGVPLRYNIYLDELEFTDKNGEIWALSNPENVQSVEIGEQKLVYCPYVITKRIHQGFFLVLEEGKMSLFRKPKMFVQEAKQPGAYRDAEPARFVNRPDEFYLQQANQAAHLLTSVRDLPMLFPDRRSELTAFIKEHKVRITKPETLIQLVQYYNRL